MVRRYHLSKKKIKEIKKNLAIPIEISGEFEIVEGNFTVVLVNRKPAFFYYDGKYYPTVNVLLECAPDNKFVTVDMGAVKHVLNGANIFAAGIVEADTSISSGDGVYVRDEKYGKPLAVGIALMGGEEMVREKKGAAVKNIHYYGDKIYRVLSL